MKPGTNNNLTRRTILLVLVIAGCGCGFALPPATELRFTHLTTNDGLSQGYVTAILQDRRGLMWFSTRDGLNRYDGNTFVVYKNNPNGYLWMGGGGSGLVRFDERSGGFKHYRHDPANPNSLISDNVATIYEDRHGQIWVGGQYGINRFNPATDCFTNYRPVPNDPASLVNWIWTIHEDRSGKLWLGTFGGALVRFDDEAKTFLTYPPDSRDPQSSMAGASSRSTKTGLEHLGSER